MSNKHNSESVEMYLKSVAELGGESSPVSIGRVAERLGVSPVSASEMMKRLGEQSLVEHLPYKGVQLTHNGRYIANNVIRRQRLWECFLVDHLGLDWAAVYDIACELEHATNAEVADALAVYLNHPPNCPHGNPIPDSNGRFPPSPTTTLNQLPIGHTATIKAIKPENSELLAYLYGRRLYPTQTVTVLEKAPLDGPLTLQVGDEQVILGLNLAALIIIEDKDER